jgi:hypothetical protein
VRIPTKHLDISGITRIVINRVIVWRHDNACDGPAWFKEAGGPGFDPDNRGPGIRKLPEDMHKTIVRLLEKQITIRKWQGMDVCTEQYRAWVHGNTLNIVQRSPEEWAL